jgi:hypothetical protein
MNVGHVMPGWKIPPVDPIQVKKLWNYCRPRLGEMNVGFDRTGMERRLGPVDDYVFYRVSMLRFVWMQPQNPLAPWSMGSRLAEAVFQVVATFPMELVPEDGGTYSWPFDLDAFVRQIRNQEQRWQIQ